MTEIETLLLKSLKSLSDESEAREKRLTELLTSVGKRLDTTTRQVEGLGKSVARLQKAYEILAAKWDEV